MIIGNRYFIDNPESGLHEVSKKTYEEFQRIWSMAKSPCIETLIKGTPIVFGTTGDNSFDEFRKIFTNPKDY